MFLTVANLIREIFRLLNFPIMTVKSLNILKNSFYSVLKTTNLIQTPLSKIKIKLHNFGENLIFISFQITLWRVAMNIFKELSGQEFYNFQFGTNNYEIYSLHKVLK